MAWRPRTLARAVLAMTVLVALVVAARSGLAEEARNRAVIIGINDYLYEVGKLDYCVADAKAVRDQLVQGGLFAPADVILITDDAPEPQNRPNFASLKRRFENLPVTAGEVDTLLVFFAGHGVIGADGRGYLVPIDGSLELGLELSQVRTWLAACKAKNTLLILDCCHAGKGARGPVVIAPSLAAGTGVILMASCDAKQRSYDVPESGHGVFSLYLSAGLQGKADANKDGVVAVGELFGYVRTGVSQWVDMKNQVQTPILVPEGVGQDVPLARIPATPGPNVPEIKLPEVKLPEITLPTSGTALERAEQIKKLLDEKRAEVADKSTWYAADSDYMKALGAQEKSLLEQLEKAATEGVQALTAEIEAIDRALAEGQAKGLLPGHPEMKKLSDGRQLAQGCRAQAEPYLAEAALCHALGPQAGRSLQYCPSDCFLFLYADFSGLRQSGWAAQLLQDALAITYFAPAVALYPSPGKRISTVTVCSWIATERVAMGEENERLAFLVTGDYPPADVAKAFESCMAEEGGVSHTESPGGVPILRATGVHGLCCSIPEGGLSIFAGDLASLTRALDTKRKDCRSVLDNASMRSLLQKTPYGQIRCAIDLQAVPDPNDVGFTSMSLSVDVTDGLRLDAWAKLAGPKLVEEARELPALLRQVAEEYGCPATLLRALLQGLEMRLDDAAGTVSIHLAVDEVTMQEVSKVVPLFIQSMEAEDRQDHCRANLHNIALGIAMCQNDNGGEYPVTLAELFPQYLPTTACFVCACDKDPMAIGGGLKCSYHYVGKVLPGTPTNAIIAYDKLGNHEGGRNALFADLHVAWLSEEAFQGCLKESIQLLRQKDWGKYTREQQTAIEAFYRGEPQQ